MSAISEREIISGYDKYNKQPSWAVIDTEKGELTVWDEVIETENLPVYQSAVKAYSEHGLGQVAALAPEDQTMGGKFGELPEGKTRIVRFGDSDPRLFDQIVRDGISEASRLRAQGVAQNLVDAGVNRFVNRYAATIAKIPVGNK